MTGLGLAAHAVFAGYLLGFLRLTWGVARAGGGDPWLFAEGRGAQRLTSWVFRLGFALLLAMPLIRVLAPRTAGHGAWPPAVAVAGLALALGGSALALAAQAHMGASWRIGAAEGRLGRLVTDGPFAWSRNPVFLGQIALVLGLFLASGDGLTGGLALAVALAAILQVAVEERILAASLGPAFHAYRARVPRWLNVRRGRQPSRPSNP